MDEKPWATVDLDDNETADEPLTTARKPIAPSQPNIRPTEYAEGTTEHDDDHEG